MAQVLRRENDFVLQKLTITAYTGDSYDITKLYTEFTYEENIFQATIHGSINLLDTIDLPTLLPIIGEETIEATFTRPEVGEPDQTELLPPIEFKARVYKMSPREVQGYSDKVQNYTLYFASEELFKSAQKKVNRGFKATKCSDIVQTIFDEYLKEEKEIEIEETKFEIDYVIANKSPILAIRELAARSISASTEGALFTFYEDRDKFYFKSIDSLLDQTPEKEIKYRVQNVLEKGDNHQDRTIEQDMESVQHYHHNSTFDVFEDLREGKASSRLLTIDPIRKKFQVKDFDLDQEFDNFKHLGTAKPFTQNAKILKAPEANFSLQFTQSEHERDPTQRAKMIEEYHLKRMSQKKQIQRQVTSVSLAGDPRYKAGQVIEFILPELLGKVSKEYPQELDKYLQGNYLVVSSCHIVRQNGYTVNMELVKDSFYSEIEHRDLLEVVPPEEIY